MYIFVQGALNCLVVVDAYFADMQFKAFDNLPNRRFLNGDFFLVAHLFDHLTLSAN